MKLKLGAVITVDEQHRFSVVYFEMKTILYGAVTNELVLSWVGNFIANRRQINQWYKNVKY